MIVVNFGNNNIRIVEIVSRKENKMCKPTVAAQLYWKMSQKTE